MKQLFLISIFFLMLFAGTSEASDSLEQKSDNPFRFMIKAGWGGGDYGPNGATGLGTGNYIIGLNDKHQIINFSLKLGSEMFMDEALQLMTFGLTPRLVPESNMNIYAFNYGLQYQTGVLYLSGTVGAGFMNGTVRGKFLRKSGSWFSTAYYESIHVSTLCVPLKADLGLKFGVFLMSLTYEHIISEYQPSGDIHFNLGLLF